MLSFLIGATGIVITFGVAIFVHELGHFIMARLRGVGVEAFAIGMGPKIVAWESKGTEYSLRWFPVGGFVRLHQMVREEDEPAPGGEAAADEVNASSPPEAVEQTVARIQEPDEERKSIGVAAHEDMAALYDKGLFTKLLVFTGGVFFNFLAAIAAMALLYSVGFDEPLPGEAWVGDLDPDSELAKAGLRQDDYIVEIEGAAVADLGELADQIGLVLKAGSGEDGLDVRVRRQNEVLALALPALDEENLEEYSKQWRWDNKPYVGGVVPFKPAAKAGLRERDLIVKVNDQPVERWSQMAGIIQKFADDAIQLEIIRADEDEPLLFSLVPEEDPGRPGVGIIGIINGSGRYERTQETVFAALGRAPGRTYGLLKFIAWMNYDFIRRASFKELKGNVGGPIAIMGMTAKNAQKGFAASVDWFIKLNLILAIMNLLPIPVLDGGFIVLSVIEAVIRRPVPAKILTPVYTFFALAFITLFILISYQDILNTLF